MSYANFEAVIKKVNIKPGNKQEIVIEVTNGGLDGQLEVIAEMVDNRIQIELENLMVGYKVEVDKNTKEPLLKYKVDGKGIVAEVNDSDQIELEGMPPKQVETEEKEEVIERKAIDAFLLSGLAPSYEGYHKNLVEILQRHAKGESYLKLATEFSMSSHVIVEQANKYRTEVAPLAKGYAEFIESQEEG